MRPRQHLTRHPIAAALTIWVMAGGCARTAEVALPAPATVTVLPAEGAPAKPVGAGPVSTEPGVPAPSTTVLATVAYTVTVGDTLTGIAAQFATTFEVLMALNNLQDPGRLGVGQVLLVPEPPPTTAPPAAPDPGPDPAGGSPGAQGSAPTGTGPTESAATTLPPAIKEG